MMFYVNPVSLVKSNQNNLVKIIKIHPSMSCNPFIYRLLSGSQGAGVHPSWRWVRGTEHPGQGASSSRGRKIKLLKVTMESHNVTCEVTCRL